MALTLTLTSLLTMRISEIAQDYLIRLLDALKCLNKNLVYKNKKISRLRCRRVLSRVFGHFDEVGRCRSQCGRDIFGFRESV